MVTIKSDLQDVTLVLNTREEVRVLRALMQEYILEGAHPAARGMAHDIEGTLTAILQADVQRVRKAVKK